MNCLGFAKRFFVPVVASTIRLALPCAQGAGNLWSTTVSPSGGVEMDSGSTVSYLPHSGEVIHIIYFVDNGVFFLFEED